MGHWTLMDAQMTNVRARDPGDLTTTIDMCTVELFTVHARHDTRERSSGNSGFETLQKRDHPRPDDTRHNPTHHQQISYMSYPVAPSRHVQQQGNVGPYAQLAEPAAYPPPQNVIMGTVVVDQTQPQPQPQVVVQRLPEQSTCCGNSSHCCVVSWFIAGFFFWPLWFVNFGFLKGSTGVRRVLAVCSCILAVVSTVILITLIALAVHGDFEPTPEKPVDVDRTVCKNPPNTGEDYYDLSLGNQGSYGLLFNGSDKENRRSFKDLYTSAWMNTTDCRPDLNRSTTDIDGFTFPSTHSTTCTVVNPKAVASFFADGANVTGNLERHPCSCTTVVENGPNSLHPNRAVTSITWKVWGKRSGFIDGTIQVMGCSIHLGYSATVSKIPKGSKFTMNVQTFDYPQDMSCFPGDATVEVLDLESVEGTHRAEGRPVGTCGSGNKEMSRRVKMRDVQLHDYVRTSDGSFSPVYFFSHADRNASSEFVHIDTETGHTLMLSPGHLLPVGTSRRLHSAASVQVGDSVFVNVCPTSAISTSRQTTITAVSRATGRGLFAPHTIAGDIVVNDMVASCYTDHFAKSSPALSALLQGVMLAPLRWTHRFLGTTPSFYNALFGLKTTNFIQSTFNNPMGMTRSSVNVNEDPIVGISAMAAPLVTLALGVYYRSN